MTTQSSSQSGTGAASDIDAAVAARLQKLTAKRVAQPPTANIGPVPKPTKKRRKNHPAAQSRAAALSLSLAATGALGYLFAVTDANASTVTQPAAVVASAAPVAVSGSADDPVVLESAAAAASPVGEAQVVNGAVYENKWGPVQVQAHFGADGSLTEVVVLQSPAADRKSVSINDRAVPILNSESLQAQSADVDTVSGATYTTNDYRRSLQSAIDAARGALVTQLT